LMRLGRAQDFAGAEHEEADLLIAIDTAAGAAATPSGPDAISGEWAGRANLLDPHPIYRWPIIDEVSLATRGSVEGDEAPAATSYPALIGGSAARARDVIFARRSAQRFDGKATMSADVFCHLLDSLLPRDTLPFDIWRFSPRLHPLLFVHRVEGLEPGLYALPRNLGVLEMLRAQLRQDFEWSAVAGAPTHLPLFKLFPANCKALARTLCCHQAIAADACFSLVMLSEFTSVVAANAWRYRQLHWEAGLLGQVLYLEAEAAGYRGTGIGCFFDDDLHQLIGIGTNQFQTLYCFAVGRPKTDDRIKSLPAYVGRADNLEEDRQ
jgi:nitroreductase